MALDDKTEEYSAKNIIIATGARSRELPSLPQDGEKIIGYRKAMTLPKQPKKTDRGGFWKPLELNLLISTMLLEPK